jgi:hypothetical protein
MNSRGKAVTSCGTGIGNFPKPGDPDLNSPVLTAQAGYGGIAVSWTYPGLNAHAVAHTQLYRNTVNSFETAVAYRTVSGNYYFDNSNVTVGTTYYYWIRMVSVNGTVGDVIGPASATMQPPIEQIIKELEGKIGNSQLAMDLKSRINDITSVASALDAETQNRLFGEAILTQLIQSLEANLDSIDTLVANEILQRIQGDEALVASVNLILAKANENAAAIQQEQVVRAAADSATALQVNTLQTSMANQSASLQTLQQVVIGPDGLSAQWMLKTDVNGYVSGFGLYNDGATSEFILHADTFAIGKPGRASKYPFIISTVNGQTAIALNATTMIPDGTINNLMIGQYIQSDNYNPITGTGWRIDKNGTANFSGITIRNDLGEIIVGSGTGLNWGAVSGTGKPQNGATAGNVNELLNARFQVDYALWGMYIDAGTTTEFEFGRNRVVGSTRYHLPSEGTLYIRKLLNTVKRAYWNSIPQLVSCTSGQALEATVYVGMSAGVTVKLGIQYRDGLGNIVTGLPGADGNHIISVATLSNSAFTAIETLDKYSRIGGFITVPTNSQIKSAALFLIFESGPVDGYAYFTRPYLGFRSTGQTAFSENVGTYIRSLSVDTLYIKGNAVTVPEVDRRTDEVIGSGLGTNYLVAQKTITLDHSGWIYAMFCAKQNYGSGLRTSNTYLEIPGQSVSVGGAAVTTNIAVSDAAYLPAGTHTINVYWNGEDSGVRITNRTLFVMGVKR